MRVDKKKALELGILVLGILTWILVCKSWKIGCLVSIIAIILGFLHNRSYGTEVKTTVGMVLAAVYLGFVLIVIVLLGLYLTNLHISL
ncbi:MAG: hypothetical protein VZR31_02895 [Lachnospiraceae bacterium]|jgi:hypothetical protein|nr:hypothetical protein [Lachnospiraceae bacterium]MDY5704721.1 hypothetical protein [Lachnospiraceae bacterium]MEE3357006.1 hypothetical protein [Lachnospiraceae bacterium]